MQHSIKTPILTSLLAIMIAGLVTPMHSVTAAIFEPGFETEVVAGGLVLPTNMAFAPDGRIFIAEKGGTVRLIKNGAVAPDPVITLTDINTFGDRGLIGIATDPNFLTNGYLYLSYTYENTPGANFSGPKTGRIVRVTVVGDTADESTKMVLLGTVAGSAAAPSCENFAVTSDCIPSDSSSHSVGGLRFGPDGKLYATMGDGANFDYADPLSQRAQNLDSLAGKLVRINPDGTAPADNPFYNGNPTANRSKVYALGLRNSYRLNFNAATGQLFAGDVGWSSWEEVNRITPGANYGWPCIEGTTKTSHNCTPSSATTSPTYFYAHDGNGAGSVAVGSFPSNNAYPDAYDTSLFLGDYAQNWLRRVVINAAGNFVSVHTFDDSPNGPVDVATGPDGNIYYLSIYTGELNRITHTSGNRRPVVVLNASPKSGLLPLTVNFSSVGTTDPDGDAITYQWNFGDGATSSSTNPSHTYAAAGSYQAVLTVTDSNGAAVSKATTITAGNQAPQAEITSPETGSFYVPFEQIQLTASGTDLEDGNLPASAFNWQIILHHNTHIHIIEQFAGTKNPVFTAPDHNASDVYTEIKLTVTDSAGLQTTKSINVYLNNGATGGNLIQNPSMEDTIEGSGMPFKWVNGWYGVLTPTFTYPVTGLNGAKASRVTLSTYQSGSAKWYFDPIFVEGGKTYDFESSYTATVPTKQYGQFGFPDGTYQYAVLADLPAAASSTRVTYPVTMPAGVQTFTVFHELAAVGTLTTDDFSLVKQGTVDTQAPTITTTAPAGGSMLSGTTSVAFTATDNVGVAGVTMVIDGVSTVEDTTAPYSFVWNTASTTNGAHTVSGIARDAAGNTATATPITVTVNNSAPTTSPNLIQNPSLEAGTTNNPTNWAQGGWGTNTRTFTYPVTGIDGARAARVNVTAFTNGDAKWYFANVPVTPGKTYAFSNQYRSNISTQLVAQYTLTGGAVQYAFLGTVPASATNWATTTYTLTAPANATGVTVFHIIPGVGFLEVDNYKLTDPTQGGDTTIPTVSVTAPTAGATVSATTTVTTAAADNVGVAGVTLLIDGTAVGAEDTTAPYSFVWNTASTTNGTHTVSARARDAAGNVATATAVTVTVNNGTTTTDTTKPTTAITAPTAGATVSGTTTVAATAADNIGVAGVSLLVDGILVGTEDTTAPYSFLWNTASTTNGTHSLMTRARDAAGNLGTSTAVTVTVNNTAATTSPNLIQNPSLETGTTNNPTNWAQGGWGTNTRTFTYPVTGIDGAKAARIDMTAFTNGDAKWYFTTVPVTSGKTYNFSNQYKSNVATQVVAQYSITGGTFQYVTLGTAPASATNWATTNYNLTAPANATGVTIFHVIFAVGFLEVDNYKLTDPTQAGDATNPTASITAPSAGATVSGTTTVAATAADNVGVTGVTFLVDNVVVGTEDTTAPYSFAWNTASVANGSHSLLARARDAAGNLGTSTAVTVTVSNATSSTSPNLILNGNLEAGTANNPTGWTSNSWGNHTAVFTYPVDGWTGSSSKAVRTQITSYPFPDGTGDAKWAFEKVAVTPGTVYSYADHYRSNTISDIIGQYTMSDGTFHYFGLAKEIQPTTVWQTLNATFTPPVGATHVTLFHLISAVGFLEVDDASLQSIGTGVPSETVPPVVQILTPAAGLTVSGTTTLTASSSDNVAVTYVFWAVDGIPVTGQLHTAPYSFAWNTRTVPDGTHTIKATTHDPSGNNSTHTISVTVNNTNPPSDTTPPNVTVTAPAASSTVSQAVTIDAAATDNVGVAGVTFLIDNVVVGSEDTAAPYQLSWDSATVTNGTHTITARARDASNNLATSAPIVVQVNNAPQVGGNLILNPSLETGTANNPANWTSGGFGNNTRTFTYPVAGSTGSSSRAARIDMSNYADGDAKWVFDNAAVTPGTLYTFKHSYRSTGASAVTVRYTLSNGNTQFLGLSNNPATGGAWVTKSLTVVPPANTVSVSIFQSLIGNGFLEIDDYSLTQGNENAFANGMISYTFDDGWYTHYSQALPALNAAGAKGVFYITTDEVLEEATFEQIQNPSLETTGGNGDPANWFRGGWGSNTVAYTYPVAGFSGAKAAKIDVTNYVDGDAKWFFGDVTVTETDQFVIKDSYNSNAQSEVYIRYKKADNTYTYVLLATLPSTNGTWAQWEQTITIPQDVVSFTIFHSLSRNGSLTVDAFSVKHEEQEFVTPEQVVDFQTAGHEVGGHTKTHPSLTSITASQATSEIQGSKSALSTMGITSVATMAYPFGDYNDSVKSITANAGYTAGRSVDRGYNTKVTDHYALKIQQVDRTTTIADINNWINQAKADKTWLILMFHQIDNDQAHDLGVTRAFLDQVLAAGNAAGIEDVTVAEGVARMNQ